MNKNWVPGIIASIVCRLLGLVAILGFIFGLIIFTGNLHCLWLLFLVLILDYIPVYTFERNHEKINNEVNKNTND